MSLVEYIWLNSLIYIVSNDRYIGLYLQGIPNCSSIVTRFSTEILHDFELIENFRLRLQQYMGIFTDHGTANYRVIVLLLVGTFLICLKTTTKPPWWFIALLWTATMSWYTYQHSLDFFEELVYDIPPFLVFILMVVIMTLTTQFIIEFALPSMIKILFSLLSSLIFLRFQFLFPDPCFGTLILQLCWWFLLCVDSETTSFSGCWKFYCKSRYFVFCPSFVWSEPAASCWSSDPLDWPLRVISGNILSSVMISELILLIFSFLGVG